MKGLVCFLLIFSICLAGAPSKAMVPGGGLFVAAIVIEISTVVCAVGNLVYATSKERPGWTWLAGGYITGVLNIIAGALIVSASCEGDEAYTYSIGLSMVAIGAADIYFTIWANTQPRRPYKVSIAPMVIPDARGNAALGVGLQVVGW